MFAVLAFAAGLLTQPPPTTIPEMWDAWCARCHAPDGSGKVILPLWPPKKVPIDGAWQYPPGTIGFIDGWQCAIANVPLEGKCGRYVLECGNTNGLLLHAPVSAFDEYQDTCGEFTALGQDSNGNWPAGSVLVGSN